MLIRSLLIGLLIMFLPPAACVGQMELHFDGTIPVQVPGDPSSLAWAGGLNSVQVSQVDLDQDGLKDLFLFDRSGNAVVTLLNEGAPGEVSYTLTRDHDHVYPFPSLHDWALLRDYDGDGREDIFSYSQAGFAVYRNTSEDNVLSFELVDPQVRSNYVSSNGNPVHANLFISAVDLPGIVDVDGDGDLDVLVFSLLGSFVEYHKNLSMELYGHADSLKYELRNRCWGYFSENASDNSVNLDVPCSFNVPVPEVGGGGEGMMLQQQVGDGAPKSHAGSSLTPLDLNGDGVMDLLLGDVSFNNLVALQNGGTTALGFMTSFDDQFPVYDTPVDLPLFPAAFYVDLDNDGKRDLTVSPNATTLAEDKYSMWFYKNIGTDAAPVFDLQQQDVLQNSMIDLGEGAYPVPFDHDRDGLMDLVVANHGYFQVNGSYEGRLALFRNNGTLTSPSFELINDDYAGLSTSGLGLSMYPAFADLDNDGDEDMYIGDLQGRLHFFRNVAVGQVAEFVLEQPNVLDAFGAMIDVGQFATPQFYDIDGDGSKDLLIGERNGNLNYYRNSGTTEQAAWTLMTEALGGVSTVEWWNITGHSVPFMFRNENGDREILLGSESGWLYHYGNIEGNVDGSYSLLDSAFMDMHDGIRTAPCMFDWTGDGDLDLIVGNYRGGLSFWRSDLLSTSGAQEAAVSEQFILRPNPAIGHVEFILTMTPSRNSEWVIRNSLGQEIQRLPATGMRTELPLGRLSEGVYLVRLEGPRSSSTQRLVVMRGR